MKTKLTLLSLICFALNLAGAQQFLFPSNSPPVIQLAWNPSPSPNITNYSIYTGVGPRQYTNRLAFGTSTGATITLPARGVTFYFTVTAWASGQESDFSNEVSFTPASVPSAPTMKPLVVLTVQKSVSGQGTFADTQMTYSDDPGGPEAFYRLKVDRGFALTLTPPPMPHK